MQKKGFFGKEKKIDGDESQMNFWEVVKRFLEPLFFSSKITLRAIVPSILKSLIWGVLLIVLKDITNVISNNEIESLTNLLFWFLGLSLLYYVVIIAARNWTHVIIWPYRRQCFYKKYMKKYLELDNNEVEKIGTGRLIAIVDKGFHTHVNIIVNLVQTIVPNFIQMILSFVFIYIVNIGYGIFVTIGISLLMIVVRNQQRKAQTLRKVRKELNIGIMRRFVKILMSKFEVLSTNKGDYEVNKLSNSLEENIKINIKQTNYTIWVDIILRFFVDTITFVMILIFGYGFFLGSINVGEFASLIGIIYFLDKSLNQTKKHYVDIIKQYVDIEKLRDTFDTVSTMKGYDEGEKFEYRNGNFELKNISFGYGIGNDAKNTEKRVFSDFSLKIKGGTKTAFVGESGGGKTTLIKLLSGYIKPDSGNIKIDGQFLFNDELQITNYEGSSNENTISLKSYYKHIGYLTQEPSVFDGTIRENLMYGMGNVGNDYIVPGNKNIGTKKDGYNPSLQTKIDKIIKFSKCEFIYDFAKGLDTEIGERGIRLSGGQKQRLAIAKIMLKNPDIILLDEPTSALDSFNEELITEALHNLFQDKTVIVVAHRLQTVKQASQILFFENGAVIEKGTHQELIKRGGKYKRMLDLQSGF